MFKVKYDMTEGRLRRVPNRTAALLRSHSGSPGAKMRYGTAATNVTSPFLAGGGMNQRYSPVFERAEDPTLAEDFMPADPQTQNKIFRNLIMFDPIAGPATEYWRDLAFSQNVILGGISDPKILQFYNDAIYASGIIPQMPMLLSDYLTFGKFVFHMLFDEGPGYWTEVIPHDLDYVSIRISPIPSLDPLIDIQPTQEHREWATSSDPRAVAQRMDVDPVLIALLAAGQPIPLAPENTMFLPRRVFSTDYYGTSYLTRVMPFKIYEKALLDASIAGARRRAGPLWHITVWPDATDDEMGEVLDLFFAAEEDPIGGKVVTREGVNVNPVGGGGGSDFWKLSDEWAFLSEAKMRALGISETFLSGEANWNSMEMILSTFLEKVRSVRAYFTQRILLEKMCRQLAQIHGFVKRSEAELAHGIRTGRKHKSDPEYQLPTIEWDKPLSPVADRDYMEILNGLEEKGLPIPIRMQAQVAGFDIDKAIDSFESDLETRKTIYEHKLALGKLAASYGLDEQGNTPEGGLGTGAGAEGGLEGLEGLEDESLPGGTEGGGELSDMGIGEESGFGEEAPAEESAGLEAPTGEAGGTEAGPGGVGASVDESRFDVYKKPARYLQARTAATNNLVEDLKKLPLWDGDGGLFGLSRRQVAKILDRIDHTDPRADRRQKLAESLPRTLQRDEGLDRMQAQVIQYLAIRMGFVPPISLSSDTFDFLRKYIVGKMNGNGLTKAVTNEIVMLTKIAEASGRPNQASLTSVVDTAKLLPRFEAQLPSSQLLTGLSDSPFTKG